MSFNQQSLSAAPWQSSYQQPVSDSSGQSTVSMPAPTGGWNTLDSIAAMAAEDANLLDNWFPGNQGIALRQGYRVQSPSGMGGGNVDTLAAFNGLSASKLFGFANNKIYDCTTLSAVPTDVTNAMVITSNQWGTVMMAGTMVAMNGVDAPIKYAGASWAAAVYTGISDQTKCKAPTVFKSRLYVLETGTMSMWYGGVNNITGALTEFPLGMWFRRGGTPLILATYSRDGGNGPADYLVIISTVGEILIYAGSDPSNSNWALAGRYNIGAPLSARSFETFGNELVIATVSGLLPLSKIVITGIVDDGTTYAMSRKIEPTFTTAASMYSGFGWQALLYPQGKYLLVNIPASAVTPVTSYQYVVNTTTGAWARFTGQNARCWCLFNSNLYFGTAVGTVMQADYGLSDGSTGTTKTNGSAISCDVLTSYQYYGARGRNKQFQQVRPIIQTNGSITYNVNMQVDFAVSSITAATTSAVSQTPWGSPWGSPWSDAPQVTKGWVSTNAIGYAGALRMSFMTTNQPAILNSFDVMYVDGGPM